MDPVMKEKWIAALRSGKYQQGHLRLRTGDAFCCLGVLCDLVDHEGWMVKMTYGVERDLFKVGNHIVADYYLPEFIRSDYRITSVQQTTLAQMNDALVPSNFIEIADWIEKNL
jgi:hypothetical protein